MDPPQSGALLKSGKNKVLQAISNKAIVAASRSSPTKNNAMNDDSSDDGLEFLAFALILSQ
jgi:hypothetical protein